MSNPITPDHLPLNPGHGVNLYCDHCGATYSATSGDYFMHPNEPLRCSHGTKRKGRLLRLVRFVTRVEPVE